MIRSSSVFYSSLGIQHMKIFTGILVLLVLLITSVFAGCAADAYSKACASCSFDQYGKMDQNCYGGYKTSGVACTSTTYPITSGKYANGECSAVDTCTSDLNACIVQYQSGNDSLDCQEGSVAVCFAAADECMKHVAGECGEIQSLCFAPAAGFVLLFVGMGFVKLKK